MDESNLSYNTDNSLISRETEANSINTSARKNKNKISYIKDKQIIKAIASNLNDIIAENSKMINLLVKI